MAENDIQTQQPAAQDDTQAAPRFSVQRIYVKDASFEAPDSPECFRRPYNPQINFNINSRSRKLDENFYEVILRLTADVKQDDKTLFLVEVQQGGVFEVGGLEGERLEQVLMITCPNILFPYGREAIDSLVIKGSFPALMLAPVNFEAVYLQAKRNQAEQAQAGGVN
jgi:preprotein translocase subunit SecB